MNRSSISLLLIVVFAATFFESFAQEDNTSTEEKALHLSGEITNKEDGKNLPYVHIINKNTGKGTTSDLSGEFSIAFNREDTILFSAVGFEKYSLTFTENNLTSNHYFVRIVLDRSTFTLSPVTIYALKDEAGFKQDILNHQVKDSPRKIVIPGSFEGVPQAAKTKVVFNGGLTCEGCLSAILNLFNNEAKEIKNGTIANRDYKRKQQIHKKYNVEVVKKVTGLKDKELNEFMLFCKIPDDYILEASEYEIMLAVNRCYNDFRE